MTIVDNAHSFSVKQNGDRIVIINHVEGNEQVEMSYAVEDVLELVAALMSTRQAYLEQHGTPVLSNYRIHCAACAGVGTLNVAVNALNPRFHECDTCKGQGYITLD